MGIGSGVQVSAWIKICDNTAIAYHVFDHGMVEFSLGSDVDLVATERGLHNLVTHAQEALRSVQNAADRNNGSCQTA